jgi:alanyl-tRNA synthetase
MVDLYSWLKRAVSTELLYLDNSYLKTVSVSLLDYACDKPGKCYLVFDKTIFHPKTGGQGSDTGWVRGESFEFRVEKALMVGNVVAHYGRVVGGELPAKGSPVTLELDWEPRYRAMRLHTAGHILDYAVMRVYGRHVNTLEARHSPPDAYIEYEVKHASEKIVEEILREAARIVEEARKVRAFWVSWEELSTKIYNAPNLQRLPRTSKYRIVEIEGINAIPCTGTHVSNTREVGRVKLVRLEETVRGLKLYYDVD